MKHDPRCAGRNDLNSELLDHHHRTLKAQVAIANRRHHLARNLTTLEAEDIYVPGHARLTLVLPLERDHA